MNEPIELLNMSNEELREELWQHYACREAMDWLGDRDLREAWADCPHADWLVWFMAWIAPTYAAEQFFRVQAQALVDYDRATFWTDPEPDELAAVQYTYRETLRDAVVIVDPRNEDAERLWYGYEFED